MQRLVKHRLIPVRFDDDEVEAIDGVLGKVGARSRSEFIREAVTHYLDTVKEMRIIQIRNMSKDQAKKEIRDYLARKKEADTFDIANDLKLEMDLTVQALRELWEDGEVE